MVVGIGTDIVTKTELRPEWLKPEDPFCHATFTAMEQREGAERRDRHSYFCGRFAAKEAVFKTLGLPTDTRLPLREIEILGGDLSAPAVRLHASAAEAARRRGIRSILLTLTHNADYTVAFALAQGGPNSNEEELRQT